MILSEYNRIKYIGNIQLGSTLSAGMDDAYNLGMDGIIRDCARIFKEFTFN